MNKIKLWNQNLRKESTRGYNLLYLINEEPEIIVTGTKDFCHGYLQRIYDTLPKIFKDNHDLDEWYTIENE
jgi:hypothetical protein